MLHRRVMREVYASLAGYTYYKEPIIFKTLVQLPPL
jgi:hypothetical protein